MQTASDEKLIANLEAMTRKNPLSKAAQLRRVWPQLQAALDAGYSTKAVWRAICDSGTEMSFTAFRKILWRERRRRARRANPMPRSSPNTAQLPRGPQSPHYDPLANIAPAGKGAIGQFRADAKSEDLI